MDEAAEGLSKRLSTSTSFVAPTATFARRRTDRELGDKIYSTPVVPKGREKTIPTFWDDRKSLPSRSGSVS